MKKTFLFLGLLFLLFIFLIYPLNVGWSISHEPLFWSYFGSYLGGTIGAIAGIGAIVGVFYTIKIQQKENLKNSNENRIIKQIEFHHNICNSVKIIIKRNKILEGRQAFSYLYNKKFKSIYNNIKEKFKDTDLDININHSFIKLYNEYGHQFGFYFRNLYYLIKYIDESEEIDSFYYAKLVRSQLSTPEIQLLMYNCIFYKGKGFKPLVEKYGLLNGIDITNEGDYNLEIIDESHAKLFENSAFLSNPNKN